VPREAKPFYAMSDAAIPEHLEHSMNRPAVLDGLSRQKNK
jgi:hypothetical protein